MDSTTKPNCPKCKQNEKVISIIYGKPNQDLMQQAKEKKVFLGGCCVDEDDWYCIGCEQKFKE